MSAPGYDTLLFDLDHTLLDTDAAEVAAYRHACAEVGIDDPGGAFDRYRTINRSMWSAVERGELQPTDVRTERFVRFADELGGGFDPTAMADAFVWAFAHLAELFDGARDLLESLHGDVTMALVTNGLSDVQRTRVERLELERYFDAIVISGELGVAKPDPAFFDHTFGALRGSSRSTALMIGDSIASDMRGGVAAGIATCWYNPSGAPPPADVDITHEASSYHAIARIAVGAPPSANGRAPVRRTTREDR